MKRFLLTLLVFGVAVAICVPPLQSDEQVKTNDFMRLKLNHAQKVLDGIMVEDYGEISNNAQALLLLSHESNWKTFQTEEYNRLSIDFRRSVERMSKDAKEKNLDAVSLDYLQMTMNCVQCHKYVRAEQGK